MSNLDQSLDLSQNDASASTEVYSSWPSSSSKTDSSKSSYESSLNENENESEPGSSDVDDEDNTSKPQTSEPLHDEAADSEDETWVNRHLRHGTTSGDADETVQCPCCFTVLSVCCQPHQRYTGQFRSLFVLNCETVHSQRLTVDGKRLTEELFTPVACRVCHTEVAVLDSSGVYHFCNVMY